MSKKCEHCKGELVAHEGSKEGFFHCAECGCCFLDDKSTVRPGHPICREAPADAVVAPEVPPEPEESAEEVASGADFEVVEAPEDTPAPERRSGKK